jgi:hypothetical protein
MSGSLLLPGDRGCQLLPNVLSLLFLSQNLYITKSHCTLWNTDVISGALSAILDHEGKGHIWSLMTEKLPLQPWITMSGQTFP